MPRKLSDLLPQLRALVGGLSIRDRLPQIEVAVGERRRGRGSSTRSCCASSSRSPRDDEAALAAFADAHGVEFWLQTGGPATVAPFRQARPPLAYALPEFDLRMPFAPTEFTQVNYAVNRVLVRRAMALLAPQPGERIADFFCGLGNFTLPIARRGAHAVGVEGSAALVRRARRRTRRATAWPNARRFVAANLFAATPRADRERSAARPGADRPAARRRDRARQGAARRRRVGGLQRIVYVSCAPATLARDASVLVHERGYRARGGGRGQHVPAHGARRVDRAVRA